MLFAGLASKWYNSYGEFSVTQVVHAGEYVIQILFQGTVVLS